jgi:hypothetical protein
MKVNETCVKAFQKVFDLLEERKQLTNIIDQGNTINGDEERNSRLEFYGDSSDDGKVRLDTPSGIVLASTDVTRLTLTPFVLPIVHPLMFTGSATRFFSCVLSFSLFFSLSSFLHFETVHSVFCFRGSKSCLHISSPIPHISKI